MSSLRITAIHIAATLVAALMLWSAPAQARLHDHGHAARWSWRGAALGGHGFHLLAGVYAPLAAKARDIAARCGAVVISGVRHGAVVAGTHTPSEHARGHAVDMRGNFACVYAQLRAWPGGVATDAWRVGHVHFSLGGREDGRRFVHGARRAHRRGR